MPRRVALVAVAVVVLLAAVLAWRQLAPGTRLEEAIELAPEGSARIAWTDWAGVRRELGADVDADSSTEDVEAFLDEAFTRDLSPMSALGSSAVTLHERFGFSPATLDWELFAQSGEGAVEILKPTSAASLDEVGNRLESLGWQPPEEDDGVWTGGADVLARAGSGLTPELQHFVVLEDEGLLLSSDQVGYLEQAAQVAAGDGDRVAGLDDVAGHLGEALAAAVYTGDHACGQLAMAQADEDAQAQADALIEAAGGVHPLTAFAMGQLPGGDVRVALEVEDADDAPHDADARAALASGPAPGQGGEFTDRFTVASAGSEGRVVLLDLEPADGEYVVSDLTSGPVLFATC